jgi:outer membrane receptor for ferrienterochelin and colicins
MARQIFLILSFFFLINIFLRAQVYKSVTDTIASRELGEVVVTGTFTPRALKNTPVLTRIISEKDIAASGASTIIEALESYIPGVTFSPSQAMGDNIQIQGLDNKYILILIDGERLVGERTEKVNLSRLNTADVRQVEIINGASSALYGSNAIGAVVNIITRDVTQPLQGDVRARKSGYTSILDGSLGFISGNISSRTSLSRKDMSAYQVKGTSYTANPYEDISIAQLLKYKNEKLSAEIKANYYRQENWLLEKNQTRVDGNFTTGAKAQYILSPDNTITASANSDSYDGSLVYKLRNDSSVRANACRYTSLRITDAWNVSEKIQVISGAELNLENVFSQNQFATPDKRHASNWNLFAQGEYKTAIGLEVLAGGRYVQHSQFGSYFSPNVSVMYRLDRFRIRGNVSNGFKTPTLKELYMEFPHYIGENLPFWVVGNKDLNPEQSWYKALSAEYSGGGLNASVIFYDNSIRNKINTLTIFNEMEKRTEMKYENVEEVSISGIETSLQYDFLKYFRIRGGYAFANAIDKATKRQLESNSRHTATANLQFRQSHFPFIAKARKWPYNMLVSLRLMSPRTVYSEKNGEINAISTGSYYIGNFVYSQQFPVYKDVRGDIQLGLNNFLNNVNKDFAAYNPGRTYFAGIALRF